MDQETGSAVLGRLHDLLMDLHKTLVTMERAGYESAVGAIHSPNHFLHLLTSDSWFAWLRPLSQLIVSIDEVMEQPEPPSPQLIQDLMRQTRGLLVASEVGEGFAANYFEALQNDPDVVMAHAEVARLLKVAVRPSAE